MENETKKPEDSILLRQIAETFLKNKTSVKKEKLKTGSQIQSEADTLKLMHELEVHQIELEMQNDELQRAKEKAENIAEKYTNLYDFAPAGYFTIDKDLRICELNLSGAKMLGKEVTLERVTGP